MAKAYEVVIGLDHDKGRCEPGDLYDGPAKSVPWLLETGAIKETANKAALVKAAEGDA